MVSITRKSTQKSNKNQSNLKNNYTANQTFKGQPENRETLKTSIETHQLTNNKFGISENDVVLAAIPVSNKHWLALTDTCIATGAELILPETNASAEMLAESVVNKNVTVVAATAEIWRAVYDRVNASPGEINRLRAILLDESERPRFLHCLILNALSKMKIDDVFAAYQKAPWLKKQNGR